MRALRHRYNLRTCCQEGRPAVAATNTYPSRKELGRDCLCLPVGRHESRLGRDCLCLPIGRTRVTTQAGLPMSIDWKNTNYDSILIVVDRLKKMLRDGPVQIPIDAPRLPRLNRQRLRLSLYLQVLTPLVPLMSSTAVTTNASSTKI